MSLDDPKKLCNNGQKHLEDAANTMSLGSLALVKIRGFNFSKTTSPATRDYSN